MLHPSVFSSPHAQGQAAALNRCRRSRSARPSVGCCRPATRAHQAAAAEPRRSPARPRTAPAGPRAAHGVPGRHPARGQHPARGRRPARAPSTENALMGRRLDRAKEKPPKPRVGADSKPSPDRGRASGAAPFNRCKQRKAAFNYSVHKRRRQAPSPWIPRVRITRDEVKALQTLPVKRELSFSTRCKWGEKQLQSFTINCFIQASASSGRHAFQCHPHKTPPSHPCRQPL